MNQSQALFYDITATAHAATAGAIKIAPGTSVPKTKANAVPMKAPAIAIPDPILIVLFLSFDDVNIANK